MHDKVEEFSTKFFDLAERYELHDVLIALTAIMAIIICSYEEREEVYKMFIRAMQAKMDILDDTKPVTRH